VITTHVHTQICRFIDAKPNDAQKEHTKVPSCTSEANGVTARLPCCTNAAQSESAHNQSLPPLSVRPSMQRSQRHGGFAATVAATR
jgi:hypothetical protein